MNFNIPEIGAAGIPQSYTEFQKRKFPAKTPLIEGILYRRDQISLTGRRRHGKTTLLSNIAIAGARGDKEYLGFSLPRPFTTVSFYLEDDASELQTKLMRMCEDEELERYHLYTRSDFMEWKVPIDIGQQKFVDAIWKGCQEAKPDLITFDNLGMLIGGRYNDPEIIHLLMDLTWKLTQVFNAAVLVAAHPRKEGKDDEVIDLAKEPDRFFESTMGSSHFVNSSGSLWGIQRKEEQTTIVLGSQRVKGRAAATFVELDDNDWFRIANDQQLYVLQMLTNTTKRKQAWNALTKMETFSWPEAQEATSRYLHSKSSFHFWFNELYRNRLVVDAGEKRYQVGGVVKSEDAFVMPEIKEKKWKK